MTTRVGVLAVALAAQALVQAGAMSATGGNGQVRCLGEVRVPYGAKPKAVQTLRAVREAEGAFMVAADAKASALDSSQAAADLALSYDDRNLYVSLKPAGRAAVAGDVAVSANGKTVRRAVGGRAGLRVTLPWTDFGAAQPPAGDVRCVLDLAWEGVTRAGLLALSQPQRRESVHTSFAALTAAPQFSIITHLPYPRQWGRLSLGADAAPVRPVVAVDCRDMTALNAARATRDVDGDLSDWPADAFASASILEGFVGRRYAADFATAFDVKNLYVAARFAHPDGKPVNSATAETGAGYGGGDALQIRLSADGKGSESFCAWLSPTGPALTKDVLDPSRRDMLARGGRLAFGTWPGGYTVELALPWAEVGGDSRTKDWRMTFQPWWNSSGDRFAFYAALAFDRPPAKTVAFESPKDGAVSLGVFDAAGRLVRTLLKAESCGAGRNAVDWDLKDQFGAPVASGEYALKGLVTDGVACEYLYTLGNPGNPPWPTADGRGDFLSDEAPPQAMATDGETVFVAAPGSEKGFAVMAMDARGQRLWGVCEPFYPRCVSLSYRDGRVYALYSGPIAVTREAEAAWERETGLKTRQHALGRAILVAYDAKTGRYADFSATHAHTELGARWAYRERTRPLWDLIATRDFAPENYIGQPRYFDFDMGEADNAIGFAALADVFAVSKHDDGRIELYDAKTLELRGSVAVPQPAGLCRTGDHEALAISGRRIVRLTWDAAAGAATVTALKGFGGLRAPVALTVDAKGAVYVSDWRDRMQVRKFSADGEALGEIGKAGGRPWVGRFEPDGMLLPHGLAVTRDGALFVAEADMLPKRISCWDAETGAFRRHWLGPTPYGGMSNFWIDPAEPGVFHTGGCRYSYDPETGRSEILSTEFRRLSRDQPFMPNGASCMGTGVKAVHNRYGDFICLGGRNLTVWLKRRGDVYVPCAAVGGLHSMVTDDGTGLTCWDSDIGRHLYRNVRPECFRGHAGKSGGRGGDNFSWSDANGDGLVQADEMRWHETLGRGGKWADGVQYEFYNGWGALFAADGTGHFASFASDYDVIMRIVPRGWTANGPVYDIGDATPLHFTKTKADSLYQGVYTADDGNVFAVGGVSHHCRMSSRTAAVALDPQGRVRWEWAAATSANRTDFAASGINGEWNVPGIGRILCTWNWWWNYRPYFFTEDGLYVGTFGEETTLGPAALWSESATYYAQIGRTPYLVNGANQGHHVFRVKGLEGARRFEGRVRVTDAELAAARRLEAMPVRREPPKGVIALDGTPVRMEGGKGRSFEIRTTLDREAGLLRIAADVNDPSPMLQAGTDFRTLFISGDCVDFMFAADPAAPAGRRAPAYGDRRLLLSEMRGKPVAVLFEPVTSPRAERPERLMAATVDRISLLEDARVEIVRRADGYRLTADVPLARLGLAGKAGEAGPAVLRGDVGVVFSGPAGGRELRLYRYNRETGMTADLTTEATLQPSQWGDLLVPLGKNLLKDPSFETGDAWEMNLVPEGDRAEYSDIAYAGDKSLYIETRGHVSVGQTVKLPPSASAEGRQARLRLFLRSEGLKPENRQAEGRPGAWASVWAWARGADGRVLNTAVYYKVRDTWEWTGAERPESDPGPRDIIDVALPAGTDNVRIDFKITTRGLNVPAKVWIDACELVLRGEVGK